MSKKNGKDKQKHLINGLEARQLVDLWLYLDIVTYLWSIYMDTRFLGHHQVLFVSPQ